MLTSVTPVLRVADYPRAREFWTLKLGFLVGEEGGDPPRFGVLHRDAARLFLDAWHGPDQTPSPGWRAYFHVSDVDDLAEALRRADCTFEGPANAPYGMREIVVTDPDGNRVCFGMDI